MGGRGLRRRQGQGRQGPTCARTSTASPRCAQVLGPERALMIDANQRWDLEHGDPLGRRRSPRSRRRGSRSRSAPTISSGTPSSPSAWRRRVAFPSRWARTCTPRTDSPSSSAPVPRRSCSPTSCAWAASRRSVGIAAIAAEHGATLHPHLLPELSGQLALSPAGRRRRGGAHGGGRRGRRLRPPSALSRTRPPSRSPGAP